jgi:hypothetical protein
MLVYLERDNPGIQDLVMRLEQRQGWAKGTARACRLK